MPSVKPWYDIVVPHEDIRQGRLSEAVFAANLWAVVQKSAPEMYGKSDLEVPNVYLDGLEIEHPDELPEFIDWALSGEGRDQNYGCFALDSWAAYFGAKHSEVVR